MRAPTIDDVREAQTRIKGIAVRTPLLRNDRLDAVTGARVFVKAENLQRGGAFKMRGATNAIAALDPEVRRRGVLAYSSGNHAIAVATASKLFGISAVIVMPADAPRIKIETTRGLGAEVVTYDRIKESREALGSAIAAERALSIVKPFDDANVIAGQGTAGLEIADEISPDIVLTPASGGGLASGIALALPNAVIYAVEPTGHDDIARTLASGKIETNAPGVRSICDGLLTDRMGDLTYEIAKRRFSAVVTLEDDAVRRAMKFAFLNLKLVLEPSGAIALAAALEGGVDIAGKTVAIIASGGNVDPELFKSALA
ncbi:MAG: threonine/serine dehydratase [Hyphomonadaceae bacterium]|nr:threonine/serine dehydratase [Hyphomonadaceae bacterium]